MKTRIKRFPSNILPSIMVAASATLLSASATPTPAAAAPLVMTDIGWTVTRPDGARDAPRLHLKSDGSSSDVAIDGSRPELAAARSALGAPAGPVSFTVVHEAGTLACSGRLTRANDGKGDCRFTADPRFERALADRGITLRNRRETLAMLMVDATTQLADGLTGAGLALDDASNLIAAAAMHVTPAYVGDLRSAPLALTSIDDAIACRALGVDGDYVRGLVRAGYHGLTVDQTISMKALGITPDYAREMNLAAGGAK